jgi:hypothetical protein
MSPIFLKEADDAAWFYQKQQPGLETRFFEALLKNENVDNEKSYVLGRLRS